MKFRDKTLLWGFIFLTAGSLHAQSSQRTECKTDTMTVNVLVESSLNLYFDGQDSQYRDYCLVEYSSSLKDAYSSKVFFLLYEDYSTGLANKIPLCPFDLPGYNLARFMLQKMTQNSDSISVFNRKFGKNGQEFVWKVATLKLVVFPLGKHEIHTVNFERNCRRRKNYSFVSNPEVFYIVEILEYD